MIILILTIFFSLTSLDLLYSQTNESTQVTNQKQTIPLSIQKYITKKAREIVSKSGFTVRGGKTVTIENNSFSGDETYRPPSAYTPYRRIETAKFYAKGNISGFLEVEAELVSSSEGDEWGYTSQLFKQHINLKGKYFLIEIGDININYPYSSFVLNNKNITGIKAHIQYKGFELLGVYSIPKGKPKMDEFYGDGLQGPYPLNSEGNFIIEGSETVTLDGRVLKRGVDYQIDIYNGEIIFLKKPLLTTEKVKVVYEVMENPYNRKLIGASLSIKPSQFIRTGIDFATEYDDESSYLKATEHGIITTIKPMKHTIVGLNTDLTLNPNIPIIEYINLYQEWAYNYKNRDITTDRDRLYIQAARNKTKIGGKYYTLGLGGAVIGDDYQQIGISPLKEDSYDYGYNLEIKPAKFLIFNSDYYFLKDRDKSTNLSLTNIQQEIKNQIQISPTKHNEIKLFRRDYKDFDKVTRDIKENNTKAEILTEFTNIKITIGGIYNEFLQRLPQTLYDKRIERGGMINTALKNIEWIKASSSFEILRVESDTDGIYNKWKFNFFTHLNHKEKYQFITTLDYTKGEIMAVYSLSNLVTSHKKADEIWILDLKAILNPVDEFKNQLHYKINNYKEIYNNEYKPIIQHTGSAKSSIKTGGFGFLDYQFDTIFHIRKDTGQKTQWIYRHFGKLRTGFTKWLLNQFQYKSDEKNIRLKLEPDKLQTESSREMRDNIKVVPEKSFSIDLNGYYKKFSKEGYYDIGIDNLLGDHTFKYATMEEKTKHFDGEVKQKMGTGWLVGIFYGMTGYKLIDDYKISVGRYYTASDTTTAAKLSDTDYLETIGGASVGWEPFMWVNFLANYYRSYLKDRTGNYSQKITNIFKTGLTLAFVNLSLDFKLQYDSSYYQAEAERPSRTILASNLKYYYKTHINITGNVNYEDSKYPDYRYITSRLNLEINF